MRLVSFASSLSNANGHSVHNTLWLASRDSSLQLIWLRSLTDSRSGLERHSLAALSGIWTTAVGHIVRSAIDTLHAFFRVTRASGGSRRRRCRDLFQLRRC